MMVGLNSDICERTFRCSLLLLSFLFISVVLVVVIQLMSISTCYFSLCLDPSFTFLSPDDFPSSGLMSFEIPQYAVFCSICKTEATGGEQTLFTVILI